MVNIRKPKNALKFSKPASWWGSVWREGLPTGNGVVGASVYGGACDDTILINHSDLWWQGHVGVLQDVADKLPKVRDLLDSGHPRDAEPILSTGLIQKGFRPIPAVPLPLCNFKVHMKTDKTPKEYSRVLNMENGEVGVSLKDGTTRYERSVFVSRANGVIAYEITKSGAKSIDVHLSLDAHDKFNARTLSTVSKIPDGVQSKYENFFMFFSGRSDNATEFGAVAFINHNGGTQTVNHTGIHIKGADKIWVFIKPFIEMQRERAWKDLQGELKALNKYTYDKLLKEHTPLHQKLFMSAELDLHADHRDEYADKLLDHAFESGEMSTAFIEKMWGLGRYLMVTGSSAESRPLAPYGLWCGDYKAQSSQITAAGSLQTIYSHAFTGNLADYFQSIFTYYESVLPDLRKNASRLFGCRGIFVPSSMARGTGVLGSVDPSVVHFTGVAGWVCQLFYDYYRYTGDIKFLKDRALSFMKETAMFYENFFKVTEGARVYETSPSYSPDTTPLNYSMNGDIMSIAKNATIDFAITKELFKNLIEGSEIAGANKSDIPKWKDMLTRIPNYKIAADGTVKEYLDDRYQDNPTAVSSALFYPVYPGVELGDLSMEMKKAFENTAKKKLQTAVSNQTSQSLMRYANTLARLGDGDSALEILLTAVRGMAMSNLVFAETDWRGMGAGKVDTWASYTIEPNMGLTSAIQEMLVQSDSNTVKILPAIPHSLQEGSISGFLTRAGVEIMDLSWNMKKGNVVAKLKAKKATKINVQLPKGVKRFKQIGSERFNIETGLVSDLSMPNGKVVTLDMKL